MGTWILRYALVTDFHYVCEQTAILYGELRIDLKYSVWY